MSRYSVSRALVTGAGRGLGAATAERLAREGLSVAVLDVNEVGAGDTAERIAADTGWSVAAVTAAFSTGSLTGAAAGVATGRVVQRHGPAR